MFIASFNPEVDFIKTGVGWADVYGFTHTLPPSTHHKTNQKRFALKRYFFSLALASQGKLQVLLRYYSVADF